MVSRWRWGKESTRAIEVNGRIDEQRRLHLDERAMQYEEQVTRNIDLAGRFLAYLH